jgi:cell division protein FtsI/penicillin-binding protein 2
MNIAQIQFRKSVRKRTRILAFILALWTMAVLARLVQLQIFNHARCRIQVTEQNQAKLEIPPQRGTIYDRKGIILAQSIPSLTVYDSPAAGESRAQRMARIRKLESVLGLTAHDLERIRSAVDKGAGNIVLKRKLNLEDEAKIRGLGVSGIFASEETMRFYPQGALAAQVLGGVGADNTGLAGVEFKHEATLQGKKGQQLVLLDAHRREYRFETLAKPQKGNDLVLTIDSTIQYFAEKALEGAIQKYRASWGTVIISHPATGEVLAMANCPSYDPNSYPPESRESEPNRSIQHIFDPGSTFKIVTASAALESRNVSLSDIFDCRKGFIETAGSPIRDHKNFGILTFPEVIIHSSNVGTVEVGRRIGAAPMYRMIKAFKFGEKTGIELPAEALGKIRPPAEWTRRSLDSVSIGYEISVTALQILQAMNTIANRGILVPPRIVKAVQGPPVQAVANDPRIMTEETARRLIPILEKVVLDGTGQSAMTKGYTVAGKTGTTQKYDPDLKGFSSSKHMASFVGFIPVETPVLSIIVVLDEPKTDEYYGGQAAAPVFREIAVRVLRYLNIHPRPDPRPTIVAANGLKEAEQ